MEGSGFAQKLEGLDGPPKKKRRLISAVMDEKGFRLRSGCFPIRVNPDSKINFFFFPSGSIFNSFHQSCRTRDPIDHES